MDLCRFCNSCGGLTDRANSLAKEECTKKFNSETEHKTRESPACETSEHASSDGCKLPKDESKDSAGSTEESPYNKDYMSFELRLERVLAEQLRVNAEIHTNFANLEVIMALANV